MQHCFHSYCLQCPPKCKHRLSESSVVHEISQKSPSAKTAPWPFKLLQQIFLFSFSISYTQNVTKPLRGVGSPHCNAVFIPTSKTLPSCLSITILDLPLAGLAEKICRTNKMKTQLPQSQLRLQLQNLRKKLLEHSRYILHGNTI